MAVHKSAFHPIEVNPELVKNLESRPFGNWWHLGESYIVGRSYLSQEAEDGKITYHEGYDASRSYYHLQKLVRGNHTLKNLFDSIKGLQELGEQLVTIVDEQNHVIKVHGIEIKIDGNPTVEQMLAVGEGIRRHEPWLVKALFDSPSKILETKLFFTPEKKIIPLVIAANQPVDLRWDIIDGFAPSYYEFNPAHLSISVYISSDWKSTEPLLKLIGTVDHELGHAVDAYLLGLGLSLPGIPLPPPLTCHAPLSNKGMTYILQQGLCIPQLLETYGREVVEILNPEKLDDYERAIKKHGLERNWNQSVCSPVQIIIESFRKDPRRHSDFAARELKALPEFFAGSYSLFHKPGMRENLQSETPEWSAFFSLLEFADLSFPSIFDPTNSTIYNRNEHLMNFCEIASQSIKAKMSLIEETNSCTPH